MARVILILAILMPTCVFGGDVEDAMVRLINGQRQSHHLPALSYDGKLADAAQHHASWMADSGKMEHLEGSQPNVFSTWLKSNHHPVNRLITAGYVDWQDGFDHQIQDGKEVIVPRLNISNHVGENIAHGNPQSGPGRYKPATIVGGWMKSKGHREAILNDNYQEVGVGWVFTPQGDAYWCVVFGRKFK